MTNDMWDTLGYLISSCSEKERTTLTEQAVSYVGTFVIAWQKTKCNGFIQLRQVDKNVRYEFVLPIPVLLLRQRRRACAHNDFLGLGGHIDIGHSDSQMSSRVAF